MKRYYVLFLSAMLSALCLLGGAACAEALRFSGVKAESSLYRHESGSRLLVRPAVGGGRLRQCLTEFGAIVGETEAVARHTAEHWRCLIGQNALERLAHQSS